MLTPEILKAPSDRTKGSGTLVYVLDPMCSWCWAFRPVIDSLLEELPDSVSVRYVMGGLAKDSGQPMNNEMRASIQQIWRTIAERTGAEFNFDFWQRCQPRRSTYAACRAVIAAGKQERNAIPRMILAIQRAYYLQARNPSDDDTLVRLADEIGLDAVRFGSDIKSLDVESLLQEDFRWRQGAGVSSFPSLLIELDAKLHWITAGFNDISSVRQNLDAIWSRT